MSCGNNCAGCSCDEAIDPLEDILEQRIKKLEEALSQIATRSKDVEWSKADMGRIAVAALKG
jgi:hypothetical protein